MSDNSHSRLGRPPSASGSKHQRNFSLSDSAFSKLRELAARYHVSMSQFLETHIHLTHQHEYSEWLVETVGIEPEAATKLS